MLEGSSRPPRRVLAIDLSSRGFGFVVLEGPTKPVDWGTQQVCGDKRTRTIMKIGNLIALYRPDLIVLEDTAGAGSRRCTRVRLLIQELTILRSDYRIRVAFVSVAIVRRLFAANGATTKHQIAEMVAERLPELAPLRPPPRKPWMREDERMAVFDAAAFALALYDGARCSKRGRCRRG